MVISEIPKEVYAVAIHLETRLPLDKINLDSAEQDFKILREKRWREFRLNENQVLKPLIEDAIHFAIVQYICNQEAFNFRTGHFKDIDRGYKILELR